MTFEKIKIAWKAPSWVGIIVDYHIINIYVLGKSDLLALFPKIKMWIKEKMSSVLISVSKFQ